MSAAIAGLCGTALGFILNQIADCFREKRADKKASKKRAEDAYVAIADDLAKARNIYLTHRVWNIETEVPPPYEYIDKNAFEEIILLLQGAKDKRVLFVDKVTFDLLNNLTNMPYEPRQVPVRNQDGERHCVEAVPDQGDFNGGMQVLLTHMQERCKS